MKKGLIDMLRLRELLALFEGVNNIEIYGKSGLLFNDTKEKILESVDYQALFANHFVERIGLSTDSRIRPIFKIYID